MSAPVAIVGAGSIGVAWALVFARAGHPVALHDPDPGRLAAAPRELDERLARLRAHGLLDEPVQTVAARVRTSGDLADALAGAVHVQECAPERVELKRELFERLDMLADAGATLASSSSALPASCFAAELPGRARVLIAHPGNPPYLLPVVELVPAPFTAAATVDRCEALMAGAGMAPVRVAAEVEGFLFNRLQGAVLREAYALVRDGVATAEEIDRVMRDGLGRRWALIGPFETVDLNTRGGIVSHAEKMGPAYARMGAERGQDDPWTPALVARVDAERRERLPLEQWERRVAWRDEALMTLERARRELDA
ncbi:3-hydroxyacyl-CoA dehydrogenase [Conexibacter sp. JD483]|uniref:3-hydroxyacyl-CoA dehydrogenase n=1 Tax=unclassified Conexibacter TaxID=2627773 RepID=UPI00272290D3|nr:MULTISPECIES: 3-hydroxyacyl-CoA dehydrogenase [unclassified Conexibacter]MDO8185273.1 3-hydroxyacyl-CoA dehydrogenase [Conexibacter sp. CPCC 205706]MDO8198319.1 3-hydroxyacyl-CoA dehydrogenase [Conexibacter sp. CPCC 205762]MDR9367720.1 3-hydroxyacyl-CoA dehydrogenase [Conexibacter sp. JD483]